MNGEYINLLNLCRRNAIDVSVGSVLNWEECCDYLTTTLTIDYTPCKHSTGYLSCCELNIDGGQELSIKQKPFYSYKDGEAGEIYNSKGEFGEDIFDGACENITIAKLNDITHIFDSLCGKQYGGVDSEETMNCLNSHRLRHTICQKIQVNSDDEIELKKMNTEGIENKSVVVPKIKFKSTCKMDIKDKYCRTDEDCNQCVKEDPDGSFSVMNRTDGSYRCDKNKCTTTDSTNSSTNTNTNPPPTSYFCDAIDKDKFVDRRVRNGKDEFDNSKICSGGMPYISSSTTTTTT